MILVIALLMVAFAVLMWRITNRWMIRRGVNRWIARLVSTPLGLFLGLAASIPMLPEPEADPTLGNVLMGLSILILLVFFEWKTTNTAEIKSGIIARTPKPRAKRKAESAAPVAFSLKDAAEVILADNVVDQKEAELLLAILKKQNQSGMDPLSTELYKELVKSLGDGDLDDGEADNIKAILSEICDLDIAEGVEAQPPQQPPAFNQKGNRKSTASSSNRKPTQGDLIAFMYTDAQGEASNREVEFRSSSKQGGVIYLRGICQMRRAYRTFRADRMEFVCFADTGEVVAIS